MLNCNTGKGLTLVLNIQVWLEVLVVLVVLKELLVFKRGNFEWVKSPNFFLGKIIEYKKQNKNGRKKI